MKRHIVCLDGTWQTLDQNEITNIGIIARSIAHHDIKPDKEGHPIEQIVIYTQGVGAVVHALPESTFLGSIEAEIEKTAGGAFGQGLEDGIVQTYMRLAFNYEADDEIFIFGFSRGAFAARSLAGMIASVGIVSRRFVEQSWNAFRIYRSRVDSNWNDKQLADYQEACRQFRYKYGKGRRGPNGERVQSDEVPPVKYMGLFDTVVQRGIPDLFGAVNTKLNRKYRFHNLDICDNVETARHALAIDEDRLGFPPTLWENLEEANKKRGKLAIEQRWFVGMHGDVGGGVGSKLAAIPLKWITDGATEAGLRFYGTGESPLKQTLEAAGIDFTAPMSTMAFWDGFSPQNYRWRPRIIWGKQGKPTDNDCTVFDDGVALRAWSKHVRPNYSPPSLRPFRDALRDLAKKKLADHDLRGKWF